MANTPNLGLHQWSANDAFLREDFNEDFAKIDAGVSEASTKAHVFGTYQGTGDKTRAVTVELGFPPVAVLIYQLGNEYLEPPVLVLRGQELLYAGRSIATVTDTGFKVSAVADPYNGILQRPYVNMNYRYGYIAFR